MKAGVEFLIPLVGIAAACAALGVCRASYYRSKAAPKPQLARPPSHRALTDEQRAEVLEVLDSDAYADKAPAQVYASLLDAGKRLCSIRTMYRVLTAAGQVRERRDQRRHPSYVTPRLVAYGPNQVWTWDITKVPGPVRGAFLAMSRPVLKLGGGRGGDHYAAFARAARGTSASRRLESAASQSLATAPRSSRTCPATGRSRPLAGHAEP